MFGPPGIAYVYLVYGMHACLNVVTEEPGAPAALLVRAVGPVAGVDLMRADRLVRAAANRRATTAAQATADAVRIERIPNRRLASGPGLVAAAFGLDPTWTGVDLCEIRSALRLESSPDGNVPPEAIVESPRIGIAYAGEPWTSHPWRLSIAGDPSVSEPHPGRAQGPRA